MLSVLATPIGNLGDITLRALETLKACDAIVCEDTRVASKLLTMLELPKKELISFHGHSDDRRTQMIIDRLLAGQHLVLTSDAGTPGISDPGGILVGRAREANINVEAIPGPAAFLAALSVCGVPIHRFTYLGFLPLKKGRATALREIANQEMTVVFYESVHRIQRALHDLAAALSDQPDRIVVVARELTKLHEEVVRAPVKDLPALADKIMQKGEFVVIVGGKK